MNIVKPIQKTFVYLHGLKMFIAKNQCWIKMDLISHCSILPQRKKKNV